MLPRLAALPAAAFLLPAGAAAQDNQAMQPPRPSPTVTPGSASSPAVTPTSTPKLTPVPRGSPAPAATPSPTPSTPAAPPTSESAPGPIETVVLPPPRAAAPLWPWLAGAAGLLTLAFAALSLRRRAPDDAWEEPPAAPPPEPSPPHPARLTLAFHPTRAGLNLISATADGEVTVTNEGDLAVADVRADLALFSAREEQSDELAAFFAAPIARPAIPAFTLGPGEQRRFRAVAALPHDAIHALDAGGRPMFVPLAAVTAHYRAEGQERRVGQAFVLGVERRHSAKLAPMWLDTPPRQYDTVAARRHGDAVHA